MKAFKHVFRSFCSQLEVLSLSPSYPITLEVLTEWFYVAFSAGGHPKLEEEVDAAFSAGGHPKLEELEVTVILSDIRDLGQLVTELINLIRICPVLCKHSN